jgi:ABC-type transport system involved in multi-copper enzyme maturation permease subunit
MIGRIWNAYTVEMFKALRLKQTYLGPALVLAVVLCAPLLHPLHRDGVSDYGFVAYVTPLVLGFLGFLMLLTYCSSLVSSELSSGSIRAALVRPLKRHEYLLAKLLLGMTYAVLLTAITAAGSWAVAYALGELAGITFGGELIYTSEQMRTAYALGILLSLLPQFAGVAFALMVSVSTRSPAAAVGSTLGLWILLDLLKNPLHLEKLVFTSYLESPFQVFVNRCDAIETAWFPMTWYCLGASLSAWALFTAMAMLLLHRRNLTA